MSVIDVILQNSESFRKFNRARYERFQSLLNPSIRRAVNLIPVLFSVNDKRLPGYVEGDVPFGIAHFTPDEESKKFIRSRFMSTSLSFDNPNPFVQMLAVMGSVGTIAYNKKSDFDYWVCIDRTGVQAAQLANFYKKAEALQKWAVSEMKLDVHLFINDVASIKKNIFAEDDEEAFGTTVGAVLKDEFFRSSIIIAGKIPFWWAIPKSMMDRDYEELFENLPDEVRDQFIDLGNLYEISREAFLGAALFQLIKSLGNPFKSIIKIGVLEKYLFSDPGYLLLSQKLKMNIHRGNFENKMLDPYILMFEEVYDFYSTVLEDKNLLKILRQNLYLKIDPQLSKYSGMMKSQNLPYKVSEMAGYVEAWGWAQDEVRDLDNFGNWDYNRIISFWNLVKKFMILSYQKISLKIPTLNLEKTVSESDFKLLSRKIKSHFSTEPDKIDNYISFKDAPYEPVLYVDPVMDGMTESEWRMFKRDTSSDEKFITTNIKSEKDLVKLLAWAAINGLYNPSSSRIKIQSRYLYINQNHVIDILEKICSLFSPDATSLKNEYFLNPAFSGINIVILNFNIENAEKIHTIHHLYWTSWGESYLKKYETERDLVEIFTSVLKDGLAVKRNFNECCAIVSPEPFKKFYRDIEKLFSDAYEFIVKSDARTSRVMVSKLVNLYLSIRRDGDRISVDSFENMIDIMKDLTVKPRRNIIYDFHGSDWRINILREMYKLRKKNSFTVIYELRSEFIFTYAINENGNIFTFVNQKGWKDEVLVYFYSFCQNVIGRVRAAKTNPDLNQEVQIFNLAVDKFENHTIANETKKIYEMMILKYDPGFAFAAEVMKYRAEKPLYAVVFSNRSKGNNLLLKDIPEIVNEKISGGMKIHPFLKDVIFLDPRDEDLNLGSVIYFIEKYRIEYMLGKYKGTPAK